MTLLMGSVDVMVTDTLTGNVLMKMFSSYATGGSYEATGFGYGPGIGFNYGRTILILSRASGVPVVAGALNYAASLAKGDLPKVIKEEATKVKAAGMDAIIQGFKKSAPKAEAKDDFVAPEKEVVIGTITGIDIMDLDDAVEVLMRKGIYAESGMGCTGPMVMIHETKIQAAMDVLAEADYIAKGTTAC